MPGPKGIDYYIGDGTPTLAGDSFIVIKASEGTGYPPVNAPEIAWYAKEQARIRGLGALFGAYHYWHPADDNEAQLSNFLRRSNLRPGDLMQLDAETTDGLAWSVVNTRKNDMLARLRHALPQNRIMLYTYLDFLSHLDGTVGDGLWIADPDMPAGHPRVAHWVVHQYGSGAVDYDVANFADAAGLRAWAYGLAAPVPAAVVARTTEDEMILHNITGSPEVWALSGSLYWHVADPASLSSYRAAGVPQATISAAEHADILAAFRSLQPIAAEPIAGEVVQLDPAQEAAAFAKALTDPGVLAAQAKLLRDALAAAPPATLTGQIPVTLTGSGTLTTD